LQKCESPFFLKDFVYFNFVFKMKKQIFFGTKEEHNARREAEFLSLTPYERLQRFFTMVGQNAKPSDENKKGNFVLRRTERKEKDL
jgi:hypothetical protein